MAVPACGGDDVSEDASEPTTAPTTTEPEVEPLDADALREEAEALSDTLSALPSSLMGGTENDALSQWRSAAQETRRLAENWEEGDLGTVTEELEEAIDAMEELADALDAVVECAESVGPIPDLAFRFLDDECPSAIAEFGKAGGNAGTLVAAAAQAAED